MTSETCAISEQLFQRIQSEFLEMPGLRLTRTQACRLWGLDNELCVLLLARLVDEKFLTRTRDGRFMQLDRTHPPAFQQPQNGLTATISCEEKNTKYDKQKIRSW